MTNFYKCNNDCGRIVMEMTPAGQDCTTEGLTLLKANSEDAAQEKHVPVVTVRDDGKVSVKIGSAPHPMLEEHHIEWICIETTFGAIHCKLEPGDPPEALFQIRPDEIISVYEHCNLHGLWKAKEPVLPIDFDLNTVACSPEFTAGCLDPSNNSIRRPGGTCEIPLRK
ncbi:MAG: desulfoferrodoxin family protein [Oscillospiraceae bacterium]|jgi:superoxide reductase